MNLYPFEECAKEAEKRMQLGFDVFQQFNCAPVYPLGAGSNLIMCRACCEHENQYRRERYWPESNWDKLEPYIWM